PAALKPQLRHSYRPSSRPHRLARELPRYARGPGKPVLDTFRDPCGLYPALRTVTLAVLPRRALCVRRLRAFATTRGARAGGCLGVYRGRLGASGPGNTEVHSDLLESQ